MSHYDNYYHDDMYDRYKLTGKGAESIQIVCDQIQN